MPDPHFQLVASTAHADPPQPPAVSRYFSSVGSGALAAQEIAGDDLPDLLDAFPDSALRVAFVGGREAEAQA